MVIRACYAVDSLRRQSDQVPAGQLSVWWGQRLARLVAESPVGSRLTVETRGRGSRLEITVSASWHGQGDPDAGAQSARHLAHEAAGLLDAVASLTPVRSLHEAATTSAGAASLRVLPRGAAADLRDVGFATEDPVDNELWAAPRHPRPDELSRLLIAFPGVVLVQTVEPLSESEIDDARDLSLGRVIESGSALDDAVGTPVRVAASLVVVSGAEGVPLRLREHVRGWFTMIDLDESATIPGPGEGTVAPEHVAAGLLRIPIATTDAFPGVPVEPARVALDGDGLTDSGVRIGWASDMSGAESDVRLSSEVLSRHVHVIGETGTGKSTLLSALAVETALRGEGLVLLDPHGATVDRVLRELPVSARERTWVIRCGDPANPVRLNPFAVDDPDLQDLLISDIVDAFQALFDPLNQGIVGPRFQHTMRYALTTLADVRKDRASLLDVPRLLADAQLREQFLSRVTDPDVMSFWKNDILANRSNDLNEVIAWISAKFTTFASNKVVTEMLSTGTDSFDPARAMSEDRIILIDLGKGSVGAMGARILGLIYLLRFWSAALTRDDPHPFTLLVDEAHSLSALSLPSILAEGRKFGLRAVLAHQYLGQLDTRLSEALRGSAGSRVCFRVGQADARELALTFAPEFEAADLTALPQATAAVRLADTGRMIRPFTVNVDHSTSYQPPGDGADAVAEVEARSRAELVEPFRDATRVEVSDFSAAPERPTAPRPSGADELRERMRRNASRPKPAVWDDEPEPETGHLVPAAITLARRLPEARTAFVAAVAVAPDGDVMDADDDTSVADWEDELSWAGLGLLPLESRRRLARRCQAMLSHRVGDGLKAAAGVQAWNETEALFDAGSSDPIFPLRSQMDVPGIVAAQRRLVVDLLVLSREQIQEAAAHDTSPVGERANDVAVVAELERVALRRVPGDHTEPDGDWADCATRLIEATREMDPTYAVTVTHAVFDALPHPGWYARLLDVAWAAWVEGTSSGRHAQLAAMLCKASAVAPDMSLQRWDLLRGSARALVASGATSDGLDVMAFALAHPVVDDPDPERTGRAWGEYAGMLEQAQWVSGAARAFDTAATWAVEADEPDVAASLHADAERCRGLLGRPTSAAEPSD